MKDSTPHGFVYVIHAIGTSRIKLGYSAEPEKRLRELQTGSPYKLMLLGKWLADAIAERKLHEAFAEYCVSGEWFEIPAFSCLKIMEIIKGSEVNIPSRRFTKEMRAMSSDDFITQAEAARLRGGGSQIFRVNGLFIV